MILTHEALFDSEYELKRFSAFLRAQALSGASTSYSTLKDLRGVADSLYGMSTLYAFCSVIVCMISKLLRKLKL
jgi:hypothetical protein